MSEQGPEIVDATTVSNETANGLENGSSGVPLQHTTKHHREKARGLCPLLSQMSEQGPEIVDATTVSNETANGLENGSSGVSLQHTTKQVMEKKFETEWLDLSSGVIEGKEAKLLARALESNQLPNLEVLFLQGNAGDLGIRATLNALRAGYLKGLKKIILWEVSSYNQITTAEEGTDVIADALSQGLLPSLDTMDLTGMLPKLIPARMFAETIKDLLFKRSCGGGRLHESVQICLGCLLCTTVSERNHALECLRWKLQVYTGDDGIRKIARAIKNKPIDSLRILILQQNYIGDKGAASLAKILRRNLMPRLEVLDLRNNQVSYNGAKKIVTAFLKNPLLTARVRLDWPNLNCLLEDRAVAFRDNNIRLEHRLRTLNIPRESIDVDEYKDLEYYLHRPYKPGLGKFNHRLHLLCHAQFYGNGNRRFKSHNIIPEEGADGPEGIEIRRRRPYFCNTSHKFVDRDLESESSGDEEPVYFSSSGDEKKDDTSGELWSTHSGTGNRPPLSRKETALKRRTGVNRIYITSNTCGFVGAAKALGSQIGRNNPSTTHWPWHRPKKTMRQMDSIKEELLMLAERKPDEFYYMFQLRQVLLVNPKKRNKYSRVWICRSCFLKYSTLQKQGACGNSIGQPFVQPITTDAEVGSRGLNSNRKSGSTSVILLEDKSSADITIS